MDEQEEEYTEILLPQNDKRLNAFFKLNSEQKVNSIIIGTKILEIGEDKYLRLKSGKYEEEKDKLRQNHLDEIKQLKEKIRKQTKKMREFESEYSNELYNEKEKLRKQLQDNYTMQYESKISSLNDDLNNLKDKVNDLIDKRLTQQKENHQKLLNEKENTERKIKNLRDEYEKKLEKEREKLQMFNKTGDVSSKKGVEGENWVYNELLRQFKTSNVEDCHAKGHRGDFTITDGSVKGMIESKNYKKNVPKREILKFRKDIETNAELNYGILVSLKSGVVTKNDFSLEFCSGKPVVYLHNVHAEPYKIKIAYNLCKLILKNMDCFDITKEENQQLLKEKVKTITARSKRLLGKLDDFQNEMKGELNEQINDFQLFLDCLNLNN